MRFFCHIDPGSITSNIAICVAPVLIALPCGVDAHSAQPQPTTLAQPAAASVNDLSLDVRMLERQRGGGAGMLMVGVTPQLMRSSGEHVTLWDEIAPPSPRPIPLPIPIPIPVGAARAAQGNVQGNVAVYQIK
ncbi:conserved hypothetical protein [Paraburkholderia ribeironis]|uniref:Uncharacterized protein n=1 Tax=Paraburkholderia ribeironis TaxID=1247936 RepID=A0A1N7RYB9_9BURK|nr:hypothetical protein [Paraburkholderia ribeironis]SIT40128.1 conserved hypothetical protein [Paraburkholderia ribeironis]